MKRDAPLNASAAHQPLRILFPGVAISREWIILI